MPPRGGHQRHQRGKLFAGGTWFRAHVAGSHNPLPFRVQGFDPERSQPIVKGDSKILCIAAASVIAKVTRDRLMEQYHERWPQYNFAGVGGQGGHVQSFWLARMLARL